MAEQMAEQVLVPDVGEADNVEVVEILVAVGETVEKDDSLVVLESDKASMEIPSPFAGVVTSIAVKVGDSVDEGGLILELETGESAETGEPEQGVSEKKPVDTEAEVKEAEKEPESGVPDPVTETVVAEVVAEKETIRAPGEKVHAGPAVRKLAREYGVHLNEVTGSGKLGRIVREDLQLHVKNRLGQQVAGSGSGGGIPAIPEIDFAKFGEIELQPMSRIRKASAKNLHRSWLNVPHVTQFDEADITDLEIFRKSQNEELAREGIKITPLAFLIKASLSALVKYPQFNASIDPDYEHLVLKKYFNIGIAVETNDGLVVPVIRNADEMGIIELAQSAGELAALARDKKLPMDAMQGATFTISSLGGIGGTAFTPIVNAPEVAILGVSRSKVKPVYDGSEFLPRTILPLSLSYDHRAIDGAEAARFTSYLAMVLTDLRRILL
jgi:pyruvate dehydrogenase E2 component (dihydrolipoamide acetyltransferase)